MYSFFICMWDYWYDFFYNIRTLNSLSICSWSATCSSRIAAVVVQQQEDWYQKVGVHCCTLLWRSCRWSSCTGGSARVLDVLSFDSCRLILLSFCSTKKHLPVPPLGRCPVVNLSTRCSNLSLISIYCYLLVPTNIVPTFLPDPIQLEEVVREQIAGVEDPECSSAFVKFCTHLALLLFAAAVWWLQKDSARIPFSVHKIHTVMWRNTTIVW